MAMFPYEKYEEMTKEERTPVHAQKFNPEMHALDEPEANEPESNEPEANESEANQEQEEKKVNGINQTDFTNCK